MLPLPTATEIAMQTLMFDASIFLNNGKLKSSYELYIKALITAVEELKQLEFIGQIVTENNLSSIFVLAYTCLRQAKEISSSKQKHTPPPIPPKPSSLSPTLPQRPQPQRKAYSADMMRRISNPESGKPTINTYCKEDDDSEEGFSDDERERVKKPYLEIITSRPRIGRRSSTSNLSVSAPSSPLSVVTSLNAVKTFLSLPGSVSAHTDGKKGMYLPFDDKSEQDDLFLLANSTIDPQNLVLVQTSNSDSLSSSQTQSSDYLPMIPKAPLVSAYQSLQQKLDNSEKKLGELKKRNKSYDSDKQFQNLSVTVLPDLKESLNRVRNIHMSATTVPTILQFQPVLIAYQLTLIDSTIFRNIPMEAILTHTSKYPHPAITVSTDFFNYLTRLIEHAILLHQDASGRAQLVNHWIKVAGKCHDLKNYQTLKAVISALGTPPIQRLKRTWSFVPKKSMSLLEDLSELMSESSNYGRYRERLGIMADVKIPINPTTTTTTTTVMSAITTINTLNLVSTSTTPTPLQNKNSIDDGLALPKKSLRKNSFSEPTVPFLGTFIHDMTYLVALQQKSNNDWKGKNAPQHDPRLEELLKLFRNLQRSPPYSPTLTATCIKELNKHRKRKLSHALSRTSAMKKSTSVSNDYDAGGLSIEMQQCLVTQYLLTRSWVSEKTVDELSLIRETTKTCRSYSVSESLCPPSISSSASISSSNPFPPELQGSTGSLTNGGSSGGGSSSRSSSRPLSLEDDSDIPQEDTEKKEGKSTSFWLFGRKSVDQTYLKASQTTQQLTEPIMTGTIQRTTTANLPQKEIEEVHTGTTKEKKKADTVKMQRESSQGSLAASIFRKEFWKSDDKKGNRNPWLYFNSDSSTEFSSSNDTPLSAGTLSRRVSSTSLQPSPISSTSRQRSYTTVSPGKIKHNLSAHPLDPSTKTLSEISFDWRD